MHKNEDENRALHELTARIDNAWNSRDAKAFCELFREESDFRFHTGRTLRGRNEIQKHYLEYFSRKPEGEKHTTKIRHIRFVSPDVAILDSEVALFSFRENGEKDVRLKLLSNFIVSKKVGKWLISGVYLMVPAN